MMSAGLLGAATSSPAEPAAPEPATAAPPDDGKKVEEMIVEGRRYGVEKLSSPLFTRPLLDTPKTVTVVDDALLQQQQRRSLRDSLRNVTGIAIQAGEGNPPGGTDAVTIRGFSARNDIFVDGIRDVGLFFRDPFDAKRIEVLKGPGSAIAGRGNVGGTINIVSRMPDLENRVAGEASVGSDDFYRATADVNRVLNEEYGIAFRANTMFHDADIPGRDEVTSERWAIAPALAFGLGRDTTINLHYFHQEEDDLPDGGIPNGRNQSLAGSGFEGRPAPVSRDSFFGHTTDFREVETDRLTLRIDHAFTPAISLRSQFRWAVTSTDQIISSPRLFGSPTTLDQTTEAVGNQKPRKQRDSILIGQTNLTFDFDTLGIGHTVVTGIEASREESRNRRRLDANGPTTSLFEPRPRAADPIFFNGTTAKTQTDVVAVYAFDTIEITPKWLLSGGFRYDHVRSQAKSFDETGTLPGFVIDLENKDDEVSGNVGLVFKPIDSVSLFAAWGTSFETNARSDIVQLAGGNNNPPTTPEQFELDPERTESFEVGGKWAALDGRLTLTGSLFQITKTDARTPGADPSDPPVVLDGEQRIRGAEVGIVGAPLPQWNVFAGYTFLDGEVSESNNDFEEGNRLPLTPEHSFTFWTAYDVLPDLTLGGGLQYVARLTSNIKTSPTGNFTIRTGDYVLLDLFAEYRFTERLSARLNLDNVTDEFYFIGVSSGQSIPGPARSLRFALIADF